MKLSLVVTTPGKQEGKVLEIKLTQFVIGRDPQCHLRPASPMISKRHCALIQRDGKVFLRDFDSTNGSFVNDEPAKGEVELKNDDRLKVGPLQFLVRLEETAPVDRPTPPPATRAPGKAITAPGPRAAAPQPAERDSTPPPATKGTTGDDEEIAAMLLSLGDDASSDESLSTDGVPEGSTVMEIVVPPGSVPDANHPDDAKAKPQDPPRDTAHAAKSILEKMWKRPRT